MLDSFLQQYAEITEQTLQQASDAIAIDLRQLVVSGPAETIAKTAITQPLMLCADMVVWRVLQSLQSCQPKVVAGHSLGEYAALVASGVLDFADAVRLVHLRGKAMQQAVPAGEGAVAAILGLADEQVVDLCQRHSEEDAIVEAVNFNAPGQVVVAGHKAAVQQLIALATEAGAKRAVLLPLSVPVHCQLMQPASKQLAEAFVDCDWQDPKIPIMHNVNAQISVSVAQIQQNLLAQVYSPVLWTQCMQNLTQVTTIIECGPGKVLLGLNRRIVKSLKHLSLATAEDMQLLTELNHD